MDEIFIFKDSVMPEYQLIEKNENIDKRDFFDFRTFRSGLKFGAAKSDRPEKNKRVIEELANMFKKIPIFQSLDIFAEEKARLKKEGNTVDDFDLLIGSTSIANRMILVTNNEKHFSKLKNIQIENWTKLEL